MVKKQGNLGHVMVKNQGIKRLIVEIPIELHAKIKKRSKLRYITMRMWALRAILERITIEERNDKIE